MAITTYAELQDRVEDWLERSDLEQIIPDFITVFESHVNRVLRVRQMESTSESYIDENALITLPDDYLKWRDVVYQGDVQTQVSYVSPTYLRARYPDIPTGVPVHFTVEGVDLVFRPFNTDTLVKLYYYAKVPRLADSNPTNWLLDENPDAYLFGALTEASAYVPDAEKAILWKARRDEALTEIARLSDVSVGCGTIRKPEGYIV